jgi:alpha-glucuronidase
LLAVAQTAIFIKRECGPCLREASMTDISAATEWRPVHWIRRTMWLCVLLMLARTASAEDGSAAWLRYAAIPQPGRYSFLPTEIVVRQSSPGADAAAAELKRGLAAMLGRPFRIVSSSAATPGSPLLILSEPTLPVSSSTPPGMDGFVITRQPETTGTTLRLEGSPRGQLYAAFHLLEEIGSSQPIPTREAQTPSAPIRWTDEWDNLNGTIERGYAGASIFFEDGHVRPDLTRASEYARLLASVGINGCNVNNVNADLDLLTTQHLREFARLADSFRPWGVRLALSVDLSSPQTVGHLASFDPLDPRVIAWWRGKADEVYASIPDFAGFTVKADSEGRPGPSQYGRTPAQAANMLARALRPHGGVVLYRGFVYNHHLDWHDSKADRARAGFDNFAALDGKFEPNVIIQIKHGPIDFQAREPVSPLFAALRHTNQAIELQTSQEYTGQQRHMVWLPAMWKWALDTDLRAGGMSTPLKQIVTGQSFHQPLGGFVSVVNVGTDANWLHHPMAMANLYGYGRLAWNPDTSLKAIATTWTRLTWGSDPEVDRTVTSLLLHSWQVYEGYTGPNGMGTLTDILGVHFGPGIESAERNGWGQWFRGDRDGIGMDRTVATGTGFAGQYPPELAAIYESLTTCPDDLLLFFHHVPYSYRLHRGKTLVQSIYATHYAAARAAAEYVPQWKKLHGKIDEERYQRTLALFTYQAGHALVWRDAIDDWFHSISGIDDAQGRVGHHPNRVEAEDMTAVMYTPVEITPRETASKGKAMVCYVAHGCSLQTIVRKPARLYDIAVQYFDLRTGVSHYKLLVNGHEEAHWAADDTLPPGVVRTQMDGQTSTRFTAHRIALKPGDVVKLFAVPDLHGSAASGLQDSASAATAEATPQTGEPAPVDYLEIAPAGAITPQ